MKLEDIIKRDEFISYPVRICRYLGFEDTDGLKSAKFVSVEDSYTTYFGCINISDNKPTVKVCEVVEDANDDLYSIDHGYRIGLRPIGERHIHWYYQSDFYTLLKQDLIVLYQDGDKIEHQMWEEQIPNTRAYIVHEADVLVTKTKA